MCVRAGMRSRFDDPKLIIVFPPLGEAHTITFTVKDSLPARAFPAISLFSRSLSSRADGSPQSDSATIDRPLCQKREKQDSTLPSGVWSL